MTTAIYKETPVLLRASAALTDAFVATTESLDVSQAARADVFLDYTKGGSATALEFYAERRWGRPSPPCAAPSPSSPSSSTSA
jgi:hypothetical protein